MLLFSWAIFLLLMKYCDLLSLSIGGCLGPFSGYTCYNLQFTTILLFKFLFVTGIVPTHTLFPSLLQCLLFSSHTKIVCTTNTN